jgi:hypothetical protein
VRSESGEWRARAAFWDTQEESSWSDSSCDVQGGPDILSTGDSSSALDVSACIVESAACTRRDSSRDVRGEPARLMSVFLTYLACTRRTRLDASRASRWTRRIGG